MGRRSRADIEQERNMAALEALFFGQLANQTKSAKWRRKGDQAADQAWRLDDELRATPSPETPPGNRGEG